MRTRTLRVNHVRGAVEATGHRLKECSTRTFSDQALSVRGERKAKKRVVIAVARKLAVLLHRLWRTREVYEPLRKAGGAHDAAVTAA